MNLTVVPKLGKILTERKMTQTQLVELIGTDKITQATVSRFDKNEKHMDIHLVLISRALGLHIEDLFEVIEEGDAE